MNRSERTSGPWACQGTVLFLESKDHGRLALEKNSYERDRGKKMHRPVLILAFFVEGERGDEKKLPKGAPGIAEVSLAQSPMTTRKKASHFVSYSLDEIDHHKDSMTDLTTPGSLPCKELQSYPSSKRLEKAKFVLPRKSGKISWLRQFPRKLCRWASKLPRKLCSGCKIS